MEDDVLSYDNARPSTLYYKAPINSANDEDSDIDSKH